MPLFLHKLTLSLFRNHEAARLDFAPATGADPARLIVLTGPNGAGKTNILEAISLLTPGKGLRHADSEEMTRRAAVGGAAEGWAVAAEIEKHDGTLSRLGCGYDPRTAKRRLRIDGKEARASSAFATYFAALWLTPQMDRLFVEGASGRRRFFDRMVVAYAPDHAARLTRYEKLQRERLALLQTRRHDDRWLSPVEQQMAGEAVAIAAARLFVCERLQQHTGALAAAQSLFPAPQVRIDGWAEDALQSRPALAVEESYADLLRVNRDDDAMRGRTGMGVHRSDMQVTYAAKNMPAALASTGEQKALLIALVLAHAQMMQAEKGFAPVLLLDEVAAHLDDARRAQLLSFLTRLGGQIFFTGTDEAAFAAVTDQAAFFRLVPGPGGVARLLQAKGAAAAAAGDGGIL